MSKIIPAETVDGLDWRWLAEQVERSPRNFLAAASEFAARDAKTPLADLLAEVEAGEIFPRVVEWTLLDARRVTLVPPGHWLLIEDSAPFRATLEIRIRNPESAIQRSRSIHRRRRPSYRRALRRAISAAETELTLGTLRHRPRKKFRQPSGFSHPNRNRHLPASSCQRLTPWFY